MDRIDYSFPYWGPFVMESKVGSEFVDILLEKGNESRKSGKKKLDARSTLAGVIDDEYYYEDDFPSWFVPRFTPYLNAYISALKSDWHLDVVHEKHISYEISKLWINYQKAYEYNPPHHHHLDLSFIVYLQVPDEIKKENEKLRGVHNNDGPGAVCFSYGEPKFPSITYFSRLPKVGDMFIFPAWLTHYVLAFKSDVERISVSGNIIIMKES